MPNSSPLTIACVLGASLVLLGCEEQVVEAEPPVRAIKTYTVTEIATGQARKFAGQVHATDSATLSFHVGGNVKEMNVNQGDTVQENQVLAVVDKQPYALDVESAEADVQKAQAQLTRSEQDFERQKQLFQQGWVAKSRFDRVQADLVSSRGQLDLATSKLNLAKRDLRLTDLRAPYGGTISQKHVETFVEVQPGQPIYEIEATGALEVRFDIPETVIARVSVGMPVSVKFPTSAGRVLQARITEIGSAAGTANSFPVKAALTDPPADIRSGMTTETTVLLAQESGNTGYLVPISAIAPGEGTGRGYVFIYDPATQTVKKTAVKGAGALDSFVNVIDGVKAGDVVASAGVTFLNDDQKVKLMTQQAPSAETAPVATQ